MMQYSTIIVDPAYLLIYIFVKRKKKKKKKENMQTSERKVRKLLTSHSVQLV